MKSIKKKQCNQCSIVSRWVYRVKIPNLYDYPILLCDDCILDQYRNVKNYKKVEII